MLKKPVTAHRSAATLAGRREGLIIAKTGGMNNSHHRWTEKDTTDALKDCAYEEYLGLKLYLQDPLPQIKQAIDVSRNKLFTDHEFPTYPEASIVLPGDAKGYFLRPGIITPSNCVDFSQAGGKNLGRASRFVSKATDQWMWIRASSMKGDDSDDETKYRIFASSHSIHPRNVLQGEIGNCGFCSGFASVAAEFPQIIYNAFGAYSEEYIHSCGAYSLRLYPQGKKRFLLLDDYLLCMRNPDGSLSHKSPSMHSLKEQDLWIRLLEKAFVKIQGSYASLEGYYKYNSLYRHPGRALQLLTGAPMAVEVHFTPSAYKRFNLQANAEDVYQTLLRTQGVCARVAHCRRSIRGLFSNHGYSLLWVGEAGGVRLVCLRNPHGCRSFQGEWGFGSSKWQTEEEVVLQLLETNDCFAKCTVTGQVIWKQNDNSEDTINGKMDDGIFFMGFHEFLRSFPIVTLVRAMVSTSNGNDINENNVAGDVPDCVHIVKRTDLHFVNEM